VSQLALVVAQHRGRNNALSGVQLSALSAALLKLSQFARSKQGWLANGFKRHLYDLHYLS